MESRAVPPISELPAQGAGVMNFLVPEGTNLVGGDLRHGDSPAIKCSEFDLEAMPAFIDMNDCSDVANRKPVFREVRCQSDAVQFFDHAARG